MKTLLLLASLSPGCLVVPTTKTTTTDLGKEIDVAHVAERGIEISGEAKAGTITLSARRNRDCERRHLAVSRVVTTTHAKLGGTRDIRGKIFGALLAPVTIPVSAAITGIVVASSQAEAKRVQKIESVEKYACVEVAADLPVQVTLASGAVRDLRTNSAGMVAFAIPDDEPSASTVIARAESASASIEYQRPLAPVAAVREATRSCAGKLGFTGALSVRITVGSTGTATQVGLDAGSADLATCVTSSVAKLAFSSQHHGKSLVFPFQLR